MSDQEMRDRLTRLESAVGIHEADGGLRGDVRGIKRDVGVLFGLVRAIEKRIYLAIGGGVVCVWLAERFLGQ